MQGSTIKLQLQQNEAALEIKITPEYFNQISAWRVEVADGTEAVITQDDKGVWMQRNRDNLCPDEIRKIGEAIEQCILSGNS
jgi:hypothetical protein